MNKLVKSMAALLLSSSILVACGQNAEAVDNVAAVESEEESTLLETTSSETTTTDGTEATGFDLSFSATDLETGYSAETITTISLADNATTYEGNGVSVEGDIVKITAGGDYSIEGTLSDGQLVVSAADTEKVRIQLNGVVITSFTSAPIIIEEADKVWLTMAEGSENILTDTAGSTAMLGDSTIDGAIYSKADLALQGAGTLTVYANNRHGIVSKDDLVITGGNYHILANGQGLSGKDAVKIKDGNFTLTTQKDAIQADNIDDPTRGYIYIEGGNFVIDSQGDALQAESYLAIAGGYFEIITGGGSENGVIHTESMNPFGGDANETTTETDTTVSTKGLKVSNELLISGGEFYFNTADDSIHSNGSASLYAGNLTIDSGDDGIHADGDLLIDGTTINITQSYEGIEASTITVEAGDISVFADDDGFNVAGGNDQSSLNRMGANPFDVNEENLLLINGGTIYVNAYGDGLDSNGYTIINGGDITISGPENGGNGTLDAGGGTTITGGTLVGSGSSGMAEGFASDSTQVNVLQNLEATYEAGTEITISDATGNVMLSWIADKTFNSLVFSSSELTIGETYTISIAGDLTELTLTDTVNSNGGFGGMMQPGGDNMMQPGNNMPTPPDMNSNEMPMMPEEPIEANDYL